MGGYPGSNTESPGGQTSGETRIPGVTGTFPALPSAPAAPQGPPQVAPQASPAGPEGPDAAPVAPPTAEQWATYQALQRTTEQKYQSDLAAANARIAEIEQSHTQTSTEQKIQLRAQELYVLGAQQEDVDMSRLEEWAIRKATADVEAEQEGESEKRDAKALRAIKAQEARIEELKPWMREKLKESGLSQAEFEAAVRSTGTQPTDKQFEVKVLEATQRALANKIATSRHQTVEDLINSTPSPGASAGGGASGFVPNPRLRGTPEYDRMIKAAWKSAEG